MIKTKETLLAQVDRCSKCGACREVCPVFLAKGSEPYVARAKVQLAGAWLDGNLSPSRRLQELMGYCLLCKTCTHHCPNGVQVDRLVLAARAEAGPARRSLVRLAATGILPHPRRMWVAHGVFRLTQGTLTRLRPALQGLPQVPRKPFTQHYPAVLPVARPRRRVGYFLGCMIQYFWHRVGDAAIHVLREHDGEVVLLPGCCGMPAAAQGAAGIARQQAEMVVRQAEQARVEAVVTTCASCGLALAGYGDELSTPAARAFSQRVRDISAFLMETGLNRDLGVVETVVTYHDPCHLRRGQGVWQQPREILRCIPGVDLREMEQPDRCCGGSGTFAFSHPEVAAAIGGLKAEMAARTGAAVVATGCPSCQLQLAGVLDRAGQAVRVAHTVEILSQAYAARLTP